MGSSVAFRPELPPPASTYSPHHGFAYPARAEGLGKKRGAQRNRAVLPHAQQRAAVGHKCRALEMHLVGILTQHSLALRPRTKQPLSLLFYKMEIIENICKVLVQHLAPTNHSLETYLSYYHLGQRGDFLGDAGKGAGTKAGLDTEGREGKGSYNCD